MRGPKGLDRTSTQEVQVRQNESTHSPHSGTQRGLMLTVIATSGALPKRILTFGDSLTAGLVATTGQYCPYGDVLSAELLGKAEVVTRGVVLESVHAMPKRLVKCLRDDGDFDGVMIIGGSNDLWRGCSDTILASLNELYDEAGRHGAWALGMATLPPFEPAVMKWLSFTGVLENTEQTRLEVNERIRDACVSNTGAFLVDLATLSQLPVMSRADGLHFEVCGYERLGREAAASLQRFCESQVGET